MQFHSVISKMRGFKMGSFNIASIVKHYEELQILMENNPLIYYVSMNPD